MIGDLHDGHDVPAGTFKDENASPSPSPRRGRPGEGRGEVHFPDRTGTLDPDDQIELPPRPRRRNRRIYIASALLALVIVGVCAATWQFARPRYKVRLTHAVGLEHMSVQVSYPADWFVAYEHAADTVEPGAPLAWIRLAPSPSNSLQAIIDQYVYHVSRDELADVYFQMMLQPISSFQGVDAEARRLEPGLQSITRPGGTYTLKKRLCPSGPMLDISIEPGGQSVVAADNMMILYPEPMAGGARYELILHYRGPKSLKARLRETADDVLSRIRLVKEVERPSR